MGKASSLLRMASLGVMAITIGHFVHPFGDGESPPPHAASALPLRLAPPPHDRLGAARSLPAPANGDVAQVIDAPADHFVVIDPPPIPKSATPERDCVPQLQLSARPGAQLALALHALCQPGQRIVIHHAGLIFADRLNQRGVLHRELPAFAANGAVKIRFADGHALAAAAFVPDLAQIRRFALQWTAHDPFELHAQENGAAYGTAAHLHQGNPQLRALGRLQLLGDADAERPLRAQVYTWPEDALAPVDLGIEAEVTAQSCNQELLGETLYLQRGQISHAELLLAMPSCDAIGDRIVLKNLSLNKTVAAMNQTFR